MIYEEVKREYKEIKKTEAKLRAKLRREHQKAIDASLGREHAAREKMKRARFDARMVPLPKTNMEHKIIEAGYKALSLKLHPDKGGNHEEMIRLNAAIRQLRAEKI